MSARSLDGRVALITGGGQGVGLGMAGAFAGAGARLVLTGHDASKLEGVASELRSGGTDVITVAGDVRTRATAQNNVAEAIEHFGRLDILVNNAQSSVPGVPLEQIDDATISLTMDPGLGTMSRVNRIPAPQGTWRRDYQFRLARRRIRRRQLRHLRCNQGSHPGTLPHGRARVGKHGIRVNVICPAALSPAAVKFLNENPEGSRVLPGAIRWIFRRPRG